MAMGTVLLLAACGGSGAPVTTNQPPTASLAASPSTVSSGGAALLTWSSTSATACKASGGWSGPLASNGSQNTGALTADNTYSLTCSGAGGTSPAVNATVRVSPAPTATLTASPTTIASGGSSTLTWTSTHATSCAASGGWSGAKAASGTQSTGALTTSAAYSLTCTGPGGTSAPATATVTIGTIPTATLNANPTSIAGGGTSTLTWSSTNATSCTATGGTFAGTKAASGSQSTGALTASTTYSLRCSGAGGTSTAASATVTIAPVPTATLTASPSPIASGASSTLTWSSTNATSCTASGGWTGTKTVSGTQSTGALTANTTYSLTCTGAGGTSTAASATVTIASGTVTVSPKAAGITLWQTQQFTATVPGGGTPVWSVDTVQGGNSTVGTIVSTGTATATYTPGTATGTHTILAASGIDSGTANLGVTDLAGIYTFHNDLSRDGANTQEYALTPSNVNAGGFGKLASCPVDGAIYGQPLWVANLTVGGTKHNVVFVATQHDSVYAFDADSSSCATPLWHANLLDTAHGGAVGETSVLYTYIPGLSGDVQPEIGVVGTPVIDPSTNIIYAVSKSTDSTQTNFYQRLHAIDLATGLEKTGSPMSISGSAAGDGDGGTTVTFSAKQENQRPGLAFVNGTVYIAWGSHEDLAPFYGWMMGYHYNGTAFSQTAVFNAAPNKNVAAGAAGKGAGIWMSGGAPAADAGGNLYVLTGNGIFDVVGSTTGHTNDYGDSLLKLTPAPTATPPTLTVSQYLTPTDQSNENTSDYDFGAGGAAILADLPGTSPFPHLLICGGKDGNLYVVNRDNLGGLGDGHAVQAPFYSGGEIYSTGAFWNNNLYIASVGAPMSVYPLNPSTSHFGSGTASSHAYGAGGSTPSVSAAGTANGIVWGLDDTKYCTHQSPGCGPAVLYAYDAALTPLWNSAANGADNAGFAVKFTVPTVANGKVYVGTRGNNAGGADSSTSTPGELDIYALKP